MRFQTVQEVLDWTGDFHGKLSDLFNAASSAQHRERIGMLLQYVADHEQHLRNTLKNYEVEGADRLLATWFDRAPEADTPEIPNNLNALLEAGKTDTIVEFVVAFHDRMTDAYTNLKNQANNDSLRELFDSLAQLEHNEKITLVRNAHNINDF